MFAGRHRRLASCCRWTWPCHCCTRQWPREREFQKSKRYGSCVDCSRDRRKRASQKEALVAIADEVAWLGGIVDADGAATDQTHLTREDLVTELERDVARVVD